MPKNITLSIADDVAVLMETMQEVNWSAVAKTCIKQYIEVRRNPDMTSLVEKLQKQEGEEYVKGRKRADEIANDLGYSGLNVLMKKYHDKMDEILMAEMRGEELGPGEGTPSSEDVVENLLIGKKIIEGDISDAFRKGLTDRLLQIEKALTK